jgi:thymidine kinase
MPGRLEVICGPMFAGKTTELVRRLLEAKARGESVVAIKPARDTRYSILEIATHTGETFPASPVVDAAGVLAAVARASVLAIDEVHFFGSALTPVCQDLIRRGVRVIVAGVERDHLGRPFEPFPALL